MYKEEATNCFWEGTGGGSFIDCFTKVVTFEFGG